MLYCIGCQSRGLLCVLRACAMLVLADQRRQVNASLRAALTIQRYRRAVLCSGAALWTRKGWSSQLFALGRPSLFDTKPFRFGRVGLASSKAFLSSTTASNHHVFLYSGRVESTIKELLPQVRDLSYLTIETFSSNLDMIGPIARIQNLREKLLNSFMFNPHLQRWAFPRHTDLAPPAFQ